MLCFQRKKILPKKSFFREFKTKVGFASRTQLTIKKQLEDVLKILFENRLKNVWQCREPKYIL